MRPWNRHRFTCSMGLRRRIDAGLDEHGDEIVEYAPAETLSPAVLAPSTTAEEDTAERDQQTVTATLYLPPGTKIHPFDQVTTSDGSVWDVDGEPQVWGENPFTGSPGGVVVKLLRRLG